MGLSIESRGTHLPVMLAEALAVLAPAAGRTYVDATFGDGGYSRALLDAGATVIAIDRDPRAVARGRALAQARPTLTVIEGRFGALATLVESRGWRAGTLAGVAMDLGVSSRQLDEPARGFSIRADGPLDMRMEDVGVTAADVVNGATVEELTKILWSLGGERRSRRVALAIGESRARAPFTRTGELADVVAQVLPPERRTARGAVALHPATRTFLALRVFVNDEVGELKRGLAAAETLLMPGGRLVVVSFHSTEDREVKHFFARRAGRSARASRHSPHSTDVLPAPTFRLRLPRVIRPSSAEVQGNPRARSARLRWGTRTEADAWGREEAA